MGIINNTDIANERSQKIVREIRDILTETVRARGIKATISVMELGWNTIKISTKFTNGYYGINDVYFIIYNYTDVYYGRVSIVSICETFIVSIIKYWNGLLFE